MFYTPDPSRPAYSLDTYETTDARVTWQASPKNKFTAMVSSESNCSCFFGLNGNISPEAAGSHHLFPEYRVMSTWTYTVTSNLLLWAGGTYQYTDLERATEGTGTVADRSVLELSTNYRYGAAGGQLATPGGSWGNQKSKQINQNFTLSYVRRKHAFQFGLQTMQGIQTKESSIAADSLTYTFNNQKPSSVTLWATPYNWAQRVDYYAAFVGDQWKMRRLTLNLGLRYDGEVGSVPAQHLAAGPFVPERDFPAQNNIPNFNDINPRIGVAYDLSGDGRTAIKASFSRNLAFDPPGGIVQLNNPVNLMVISTTRTWSDPGFSATDAANPNFVPGCNLQNQPPTLQMVRRAERSQQRVRHGGAHDELDARHDQWMVQTPVQLDGFGVGTARASPRPFGELSVISAPGTGTSRSPTTCRSRQPTTVRTALRSRRTPACRTAAAVTICGLYDVNPNRFGQINNSIVPAANFGRRTQVFNGIDATANYRRRGFVVTGGLSTGATVTDQCFIVDSPQQLYQCHVAQPWSANTQLKFQGVAPLPRGFQLSANFQMLPSIPQSGELRGEQRDHRAVTRPQPLSLPGERHVYGDGDDSGDHAGFGLQRRVEPAIRLPRQPGVQVRSRAGLPAIDVYNLFNASPVLAVNSAYGPAWQNVTSLLGARVAKLGVQVSF